MHSPMLSGLTFYAFYVRWHVAKRASRYGDSSTGVSVESSGWASFFLLNFSKRAASWRAAALIAHRITDEIDVLRSAAIALKNRSSSWFSFTGLTIVRFISHLKRFCFQPCKLLPRHSQHTPSDNRVDRR